VKTDIVQTTFTGGEFSPRLFGRTDIAQYTTACAVVENMLVRPYGTIISAPGTEFINDAKYDTVAGGNDGHVTLLLHGNESAGTTTFIDASSYTHSCTTFLVTSSGTAQTASVVTINSIKKFGAGSIHFSNPYIYEAASGVIVDQINNEFTGSEMTIDLWFRYRNLPDGNSGTLFRIYQQGGDVPATTPSVVWYIVAPSVSSTVATGYIYLYCNDGGSSKTISSSTLSTFNKDQWYHIAVSQGNPSFQCRAFVDGIKVMDEQNIRYNQQTNDINIGYSLNGYIDEYRISNVVRWTENFTVPDSEYGTEGSLDGISERIYGRSRLIPFVFSRNDAYAIEAGESYFRFYTNGGVVEA